MSDTSLANGGAPQAAPQSTPAGGGGVKDDGGGSEQSIGFDIPEGVDELDVAGAGAPVDGGLGGSPEPSAAPPPQQTAPPPVQQPPIQQTTQPQPPQAQAAPVPSGQQPLQTPASAAPGQIGLDQIIPLLQQSAAQVQDEWARTMFALTPEETEGLQTQAEVVIPKLMSKVLYQTMLSIPHMIQQYVPNMVGNQLQFYAKSQELENQFFSMFPQIPRARSEEVAAYAKMFRANFPTITDPQERMKQVGNMIVALWGLNPAQARQNNGQGGKPFRPAVGSSGAPMGGQGQPSNDPWGGMGLPD